jgi:catalase
MTNSVGNAGKSPTYTLSNGCPAARPEQSVKVGSNLLLRDSHLIEMLSHFNRERIPERVVHAKGAGAYGEFEVRIQHVLAS